MAGTSLDTKTSPIDFSMPTQLTLTASPAMSDGKLEFSVVITFSDVPGAGIFMLFHDNAGVFGATAGAGVAGRFTKPPTTGSYPMDPDMTIGAGVDFVNGITDNGDGTVSIKPDQVYLLNNNPTAMFNLTRWSAAAVANGTTQLDGSYTGGAFQGFNVAQDGSGTLTMNNCTLMLAKLEWLKMAVKWPPTIPASPTSNKPWDPTKIDWSQYTHVPQIKTTLFQ